MKFLFLLAFAVFTVPVPCRSSQEDSVDCRPHIVSQINRFSPNVPISSGSARTRADSEANSLQHFTSAANYPAEGFSITGKEITARPIAPDVFEVNILVRLYWQPIRGSKPRFYRDPDTQRDYDRKAEEVWSGVFRRRHLFKTLATYIVRTRILSTYGDIGAPYPDRSSTVVVQMDDYGCASTFAVRDPGPGKYGSIILHQNSRPSDYFHEIGHVLGCADRYESQSPEPGWEWNIMANPARSPDYRNIEEILRKASGPDLAAGSFNPLPSTPGFEPEALQANAPLRRSPR